MNRKDVIVHMSKEAGITAHEASKALNALFDGVRKSLISGGRATFSGFGSFEIKTRKPRKGRNPRTGAEVAIPQKRRIKFNPSKSLKSAV